MNGPGTGVNSRLLIIASIIFVLFVGAIIFFINGNNSSTPSKTTATQVQVTDLSPDRSVKITVTGPIVADESRTSYSIEISQNIRTITRYKGYENTIVDQRTYNNSRDAYQEFVYALDKQHVTRSRSIAGTTDDERGICASGMRYDIEILDDGTDALHLWTSSCSGSHGTLNANVATIRALFAAQIPDYAQVVKGTTF